MKIIYVMFYRLYKIEAKINNNKIVKYVNVPWCYQIDILNHLNIKIKIKTKVIIISILMIIV